MKRILLKVSIGILFLASSFCNASEDTTDISYILPDNGNFGGGTIEWVIQTGRDGPSPSYILATVYSYPSTISDPRGMIGLFCRNFNQLQDTNTAVVAKAIITTSTNYPLSLDTIIQDQIIVELTVMGNPTSIFRDPDTQPISNTTTIVNSTVFGIFQVEIQGAYPPSVVNYTRKPGVSPAFQEAASFKATDISVDNTSTIMMYARLTTWTKLSFRFIPQHQGFWKIKNIQLKYNARTEQNNLSGVFNGPSFDTELLVDKIRIYAIRFKP